MRRTSLLLLLLFSLFVLQACSSDDSSSDASEAPEEISYALENYCALYHEALCIQQIGCNVALNNQATSIDECQRLAEATCNPLLDTWKRSVEEGLVDYQEESMRECVDGFESLSCKELVAGFRPSVCDEVFPGSAEKGEACYTSVECATGLLCGNVGQCPGTCTDLGNDAPTLSCASLECDENSFCEGGECLPRLAENESCPNRDDACQDGLFCGKGAEGSDLLCLPQKPDESACLERQECAGEAACVPSNGADRTCSSSAGAEGEVCNDDASCQKGLICKDDIRRCSPPVAEEEVCTRATDCAEGLYCWREYDPDPLLGVCREENKVGIGEGEPCNPSLDRCRLGLFCEITDTSNVLVGECSILPGPGEPCADFSRNLNGQCKEGVCIQVGGEKVCADLREPGEPCEVRTQCLSGSCADGACVDFSEVYCAP